MTDHLSDHLSDHFSPVFEKTAYARGLASAHYTDPVWWDRERERIFTREWVALAFEADIPKPGDVFPVTLMGQPLIAVRDRDGAVRVFENACRHRGTTLVEEPTNFSGPIRCRYHSWCYSYQGDLLRTPHIGGVGEDDHPEIDKSKLGLFQVRSHCWHGVIFVNLSGVAPDFGIVQADLIARWTDFDQPSYAGGAVSRFEMTVKSNWKLAVENYCESYHLPFIHPALNETSKLEDHYNIEDHTAWSGQGSRAYRQLRDETGTRLPDFENLDPRWETGSEYISLFPNVLLGVHRDHIFAMLLMPQRPDETLERVCLSYATPDAAETHATLVERNAGFWADVFGEDVAMVEGMQRGRCGRYFDGGQFSPVMDVPTHIFHKWVAQALSGAALDGDTPIACKDAGLKRQAV